MRAFLFLLPAVLLPACGGSDPPPAAPFVDGDCAPGKPAIEMTGGAEPADVKTYRMLPFTVASSAGRVEVSYQWIERSSAPGTPITSSTLDLGLWDEKGYRSQAAFRGWGGSRQGRIDQEDPPVFVQADGADRGFSPGAVNPGTWHVEIGIAAVNPEGFDWLVRVACTDAGGTRPVSTCTSNGSMR